ncbi:MAG: hypothetical protein M3R25_07595 [Bacteroidota bacterium]|nr:hypothetical protein [Bacteroidota bacterium]
MVLLLLICNLVFTPVDVQRENVIAFNSSITQSNPCDSVPILNQQILSFVESNLRKKVDRGECWDLAATPLNIYKAKWNGKYSYGRLVNPKSECIYPGDIMQFENVEIESVSNNGRFVQYMPHHTAVVYEVHAINDFTIAHQNYNNTRKVILTPLKMENIKKGKTFIYRPIAGS